MLTGAAGREAEWRNWARTEAVTPVRRVRPRDAGEVADAVRAAVRDGLAVKALGSGHSFTGAAVAPGVALDMSAMRRLRAVDAARGLATVEAGLTLHELSPWLWRAGLALENLGDIDAQTVAGAIATGTHGTGARFGGIASRVHALELVLADGSLVTCSRRERPELFEAARIGIGAFGVVTAVTLEVVPAFPVRAAEGPEGLAGVLADVPAFVASADHAEFYWFPHTGTVLAKRNTRLAPGDPVDPQARVKAWVDDELMANSALDAVCRLGAARPRRIPALNRMSTRLMSSRAYTDRSYRVFASHRAVVFRETEWALPRELFGDVFAELRSWLDRPGHEVGFPMEVRFGPAEDAWLAPSHGRETAWIAAQTHHRQDHRPYFARVHDVMRAAGARPHWGKLHALGAAELAELYPRFADVLAVRDAVDPGRVFSNPYSARMFGP